MKTKVLIIVKAYPAISTKYGETVCTAGITEEGKWIRIYPIPFRKLDFKNRFKKYDWIELDLVKNNSDFRPESFRPTDLNNINTISHIETNKGSWHERSEIVLKNVYTSLGNLISEAKNRDICTSLAIFKPTKIIDFTYEPTYSEWDKSKIQLLESLKKQGSLFDNDDENDIQNFEVVDKVPYKFSFIFEDIENKKSRLMIEDWETGMLYWNSLEKHSGNEAKACEAVKEKYFYDFAKKKDYYFILGTTKLHHLIAPNPFVIIGDFRPNRTNQNNLF